MLSCIGFSVNLWSNIYNNSGTGRLQLGYMKQSSNLQSELCFTPAFYSASSRRSTTHVLFPLLSFSYSRYYLIRVLKLALMIRSWNLEKQRRWISSMFVKLPLLHLEKKRAGWKETSPQHMTSRWSYRQVWNHTNKATNTSNKRGMLLRGPAPSPAKYS